MDRQKVYIELLSICFLMGTFLLSLVGEERLVIYISLFIIEYFVITSILKPKKKWFDIVGLGFIMVFCIIVILSVLSIIEGH